jgi:serine/threonine protein kinase
MRYDPDLERYVLDTEADGEIHRIPARLGDKGRYEVTGVLSAGGFGVIYRGKDRRLFDKSVLIKAIRYNRRHLRVPNNRAVLRDVEEQRERLKHELKMLVAGQNRGVAGIPILLDMVTDLGVDLYGPHDDGQGGQHWYGLDEQWRNEPYLILTYVDGAPFSRALSSDSFGRNRLGNVQQVILQIGSIVAAFHREEKLENGARISFLYQDLKPANIIFTPEKRPVLIDFGSFAVRVDGKTQNRFSRAGTPGYQPPEFVDGTPVALLDQRVDVFSMGMTVYHLLGGVAPMADAEGYSVVSPEVMQGFQAPWRSWIEKCIQRSRDERFASIEEAVGAARGLPR